VDSSDLSREQLDKLTAQVFRQLRYLNRLCERMNRVGWSSTDPVYREAYRARDAMQGLRMAVHYAGCNGVGRDSKR